MPPASCQGVVPVRVIDERASARRRETSREAAACQHRWRDTARRPPEPRHAIVVAVELDPVPVNRGRLAQTVDDLHGDGLSSCEHHDRAGHGAVAEARRGCPAPDNIDLVTGYRAVAAVGLDDELQPPPGTVRHDGCASDPGHVDSQHESRHASASTAVDAAGATCVACEPPLGSRTSIMWSSMWQ